MIHSKNFSIKVALVLSILGMAYLMLLLASALMTHKVVAIGPGITLAGVLIVPFIFVVANIIAELFGYKVAFFIVQISFLFQLFFTLICWVSIHIPSPLFWHGMSNYKFVFDPILKMSVAFYVGYLISSTLNLYVLNRWRLAWKGKKFWLRSIGSSTAGEMCCTIFIILFMQYNIVPESSFIKILITSYLIKVCISIVISIPANFIVFYLKNILNQEGFNPQRHSYNPFSET